MNGILNINKPPGMTSHDVVRQVRRLARQKRVGHAGTLDPDATGVLLVCLGSATRLSDHLADEGKRYRAILTLGAATTTEDSSGELLSETDASHLTEADLRAILPRFLGCIQQIPPMVSAVHHQGKRLYELAREGITVERKARPIQIEDIQVSHFQSGTRARATLDIACGKGTYIRTLCADIGDALEVGGHMAELCRLRVGRFMLEDATPLQTIAEEQLPSLLIAPADALSSVPTQTVNETQQGDIQHGRAVPSELTDCSIVCVLSLAGELLALARAQDNCLHPFKVFPPEIT